MKLKSVLIAVLLALIWLSSAATGLASDNGSNLASDTDKVAASKNAEAASEKSSRPATEEEVILLNEKVRKLEEMLEKQQKIIEALLPNAQPAAAEPNSNATATTVIAAPASPTQSTAAAPIDDVAKKVDSLYRALGAIKISGDLRYRAESFLNQGFDAPADLPARNRQRIRIRVQMAGEFHNNYDWAIRVASGSFTDPTSTHQTLTDFFDRKPFALDRAFIRFNSKTDPAGVILQAGKFETPWKHTELTIDNDVNVEGASQQFYIKGKGHLNEIRLIAWELPLHEVALTPDAALYGGQLQGTVSGGDFAFTGAATYNNFDRADDIARALGQPNTLVNGGLETVTTNRVRRDANGNIIGYVASFHLLDFLGEVRYNGYKRFPISLTLNYVRNLSERLNKLGERNGYWAELQVGRQQEKGDVRIGYTFTRIEQDAVLSPLNFSDILQSNSRVSRVNFSYNLNSNVYVEITGLFSLRFNHLPNVENRLLKRLQLDFNYRF